MTQDRSQAAQPETTGNTPASNPLQDFRDATPEEQRKILCSHLRPSTNPRSPYVQYQCSDFE